MDNINNMPADAAGFQLIVERFVEAATKDKEKTSRVLYQILMSSPRIDPTLLLAKAALLIDGGYNA